MSTKPTAKDDGTLRAKIHRPNSTKRTGGRPQNDATIEERAKLSWHYGNQEYHKMIGAKDFYFGPNYEDAMAQCIQTLKLWDEVKASGNKKWTDDALFRLYQLGILKRTNQLPMVQATKAVVEGIAELIKDGDLSNFVEPDGRAVTSTLPEYLMATVLDVLREQDCIKKFRNDVRNRWMTGDSVTFWKELTLINGSPVTLLSNSNQNAIPEVNIFVKGNDPPAPPIGVLDMDHWGPDANSKT